MKRIALMVLILCAPIMARETVYEFQNVKRADLYTRAITALSAEPGMQITQKNQADSSIVADGEWFMKDVLVRYPMTFTITVQASDGKIRIAYDNVRIMPSMGQSEITSKYAESDINDRLAEYDQKIIAAMKQLAAQKKK